MVWIIDEKEVFAVNKTLDIQIRRVESNNVIIVDNFYKNPELVRNLALNSPASTWTKLIKTYPDARHSMKLDLSSVSYAASRIAEKVFNVTLLDDLMFITNVFKQDDRPPGGFSAPHADPSYFSGVIYLNTPEECSGGTAFYRNKKTGLEYSLFTEKDNPVLNNHEYLTDSNKDWELIDIIEMKYNRFVMYQGNIFHSAYIKSNWFRDYYRLVQAYFFMSVVSPTTILGTVEDLKISREQNDSFKVILASGKSKTINKPYFDFIQLIDAKKTILEILSSLNINYNFSGDNFNYLKEIITDSLENGIVKIISLNL
jgi:hypothetical protein